MRNSLKFVILNFVASMAAIFLKNLDLLYLHPFQLIAFGLLS